MANIKISELNPLLTVQDADVLPIVDNAITKKVTAAILRSYTQGNSVLLTGNQTVAGIKTFTSQLASSVATGTAPFSVASTTKVTNLNADLLDGLSSADFALSTRTLTAGTGLTGGGDLTANRTFAIDSTVATLTGTQTLTNKTITSPVINEILDSNGNEILGFTPIASATDYITIKNGIGVGVPLHISAAGSSANTGLHLEPKGTGLVQISDGTDTTKGIRFRSSSSATGAITLIDAVSSAGHVVTLPNATTTLIGTNTTDTLSNKSISGATNTLSNIGNASLTNSAITINGTSTSLGGSINVGTVTSVAALTLGTSGTDLTSTVANGTTTPVITLNVPTASASNRGALSSADWTTFNNKQNALTNPITGTGTTNYLPKFTGASALGNSQLFDNGTNVGVGTITPAQKFSVSTATATSSIFLSYSETALSNLWTDLTPGIEIQNTITNTGFIGAGAGIKFYLSSSGNPQAGIFGVRQSTTSSALTFWTQNANSSVLERMRITNGGNVLIGTATDSTFKLDVNGTARVVGAVTTNSASGFRLDSAGSILFSLGYSGGTLLDRLTGTSFRIAENGTPQLTIATGGAATFVADATINGVTVGRGAGNIATNTAVGASALNANTTGANNTAIGSGANATSTTASANTAVGRTALLFNTASNNTAVGFEAAYTNTSGTDITAIGYRALKFSTGVSNTAVGSNALTANTTGANNTALGKSALIANTTGFSNTAIGESVLLANVGGTYNTAIGSAALSANVSGSNNVAIGRVALQNNTASNNVAVGFEAGSTNTTGANNIFIGYQVNGTSATDSNKTFIGNSSTTTTTLAGTLINSQTSATQIQSQTANSNTQGVAQLQKIVRYYPTITLGTKLIIPFVSQVTLNGTTFVRIIGHSSSYNSNVPQGFSAEFALGHLNSLLNLTTLNSSGNVATIAISGMNIEITFTSAYNISTANGIYTTIEYMTNNVSRSIDVANIAMN